MDTFSSACCRSTAHESSLGTVTGCGRWLGWLWHGKHHDKVVCLLELVSDLPTKSCVFLIDQVFFEPTEQYISFYDIFTRHSFGSYRDVMKEFSFNKLMAKWLSFYGNKSLQHNIDAGEVQYPDENVS